MVRATRAEFAFPTIPWRASCVAPRIALGVASACEVLFLPLALFVTSLLGVLDCGPTGIPPNHHPSAEPPDSAHPEQP